MQHNYLSVNGALNTIAENLFAADENELEEDIISYNMNKDYNRFNNYSINEIINTFTAIWDNLSENTKRKYIDALVNTNSLDITIQNSFPEDFDSKDFENKINKLF